MKTHSVGQQYYEFNVYDQCENVFLFVHIRLVDAISNDSKKCAALQKSNKILAQHPAIFISIYINMYNENLLVHFHY